MTTSCPFMLARLTAGASDSEATFQKVRQQKVASELSTQAVREDLSTLAGRIHRAGRQLLDKEARAHQTL